MIQIDELKSCTEPTETSKQPIRTRYLDHVTGYQPIRDQYFLIRSVTNMNSCSPKILGRPDLVDKSLSPEGVPKSGSDWETQTANERGSSKDTARTHTRKKIVKQRSFRKINDKTAKRVKRRHTCFVFPPSRNRPKQVNNQSLFRSRDRLSANQGPVFRSVPALPVHITRIELLFIVEYLPILAGLKQNRGLNFLKLSPPWVARKFYLGQFGQTKVLRTPKIMLFQIGQNKVLRTPKIMLFPYQSFTDSQNYPLSGDIRLFCQKVRASGGCHAQIQRRARKGG
eukprot:sb/3467819/